MINDFNCVNVKGCVSVKFLTCTKIIMQNRIAILYCLEALLIAILYYLEFSLMIKCDA